MSECVQCGKKLLDGHALNGVCDGCRGQSELPSSTGWAAAACATGNQCVIIKFGDTERHVGREEAERFAAAIYEACSESCKSSFKPPNAGDERPAAERKL
jgi:hypothetical protein